MLQNEFNYFKDNFDKLVAQYQFKYIVIKDQEVKFSSDTFEESLKFGNDNFSSGTFIVQFCGKDQSCYTQIFHSIAYFV
jgi:hypothetical protein